MLVSRGMPIVNIAKVGARSMVLSFLCLLFFFFSFSFWKKRLGRRGLGGLWCGSEVGGAIKVRRRCFLIYLD